MNVEDAVDAGECLGVRTTARLAADREVWKRGISPQCASAASMTSIARERRCIGVPRGLPLTDDPHAVFWHHDP
jgi:hypothetical protein